jgi:DNA-binding HxlR family transcriptional regulator
MTKMGKEKKSTIPDNKKDSLLDAQFTLDNTCQSIFHVLLEDKKLRFTELQNAVTKLSEHELTNRILSKHLRHLIKKGLIKKTKMGIQNVTYCLSDKYKALTQLPEEDLKNFFDLREDNLPSELQALKFDKKECYSRISGPELDRETDRDLANILSLNLWELKLLVDYDLKLAENESNVAFWNFVANPQYRMHEKDVSEKCRYNKEYKKVLFDKIELLTNALRDDRELFRKRKETRKRVRS